MIDATKLKITFHSHSIHGVWFEVKYDTLSVKSTIPTQLNKLGDGLQEAIESIFQQVCKKERNK